MPNIDEIIKNRKTNKVLANKPWDISLNGSEKENLIRDLLELAASGPYHYKSDEANHKSELTSSLPYRFYTLDTKACRKTSDYIAEKEIQAGIIKNMLDAADLLFMVTWLPEPEENKNPFKVIDTEAVPFDGNLKNMEHIAAGSAAIQNVLLGATERGLLSYWSSGGVLRQHQLRSYLSVPLDEILLGTVFIFPKDSHSKGAIVRKGGLSDTGKEINTWSKRVILS